MEHKYQWSLFLDSNKMQQIVVRCDDFDEFLQAIQLVQTQLKQWQGTLLDEPEPEIPPDQCQIHNRPMKKRQGKKGTWYDHRWQDEAGVWHICNGQEVKVVTKA